jgi:hypothetical protein
MKTFQYLACASLVLACFVEWLVAAVISTSLHETFITKDRLIPIITSYVIMRPFWILLFPVPWVIYLALRLRKQPSPEAALIYAATIGVGLTCLTGLVILGCVLPWLPLGLRIGQ